jgi:NDP-sugar pyrophosphorylase family protein
MISARDPRELLARFIGRNADHAVFGQRREWPWRLTGDAPAIVTSHLASLGIGYEVSGDIAVHVTARIEAGAIVKGPAIIGPGSFIAATAYVRGGVFLDEDCVIGPAAEIKSSFLFKGSKLAHLNFVGDSVLGEDVNCEAGSTVANCRNEREDRRMTVAFEGEIIGTGVEKFGAVLGDKVRLGANAVVAPGAFVLPGTVVPRLGLVDQHAAKPK